MLKGLEALDKLEECAYAMKDLPMSNWIDLAENEVELDLKIMDWVETIKSELLKGKQALQRLEAIDNTKSSEALECSLKLYKMVESAGNDNGFNLNEAWEYHKTIKQDLDRLEKLEKIFSDSYICEMQARFNEIKCSADKCENCPLGFESGVCLKNTFEHKWKLQEENQELKKKNRQLLDDSSTLAVKIIKLEKVLEIIKEKCYFMPLSKIKNLSYDLYVRWFDLNHYDVKSLLTREEFDSLKEVLYNESC